MTETTARRCADWWAAKLQRGDIRQRFRDALLEILRRGSLAPREQERHRAHGDVLKISVEYDPSPSLISALEAAGVARMWFMYSAKELLPYKTRMRIRLGDERVDVVEGCGADWKQLPVGPS